MSQLYSFIHTAFSYYQYKQSAFDIIISNFNQAIQLTGRQLPSLLITFSYNCFLSGGQYVFKKVKKSHNISPFLILYKVKKQMSTFFYRKIYNKYKR